VINAAYSSDGTRIVSTDTDGVARGWSSTRQPRAVVYGQGGPVNSAEFDRTGDRVVTTGIDGTVRIFEATGGEPLVVLRKDERAPLNARFTADGTRVLSAGADDLVVSTVCEVCGSFADALAVARSRFQRKLTATDRERLTAGAG
jgi:WD40 repeat protein